MRRGDIRWKRDGMGQEDKKGHWLIDMHCLDKGEGISLHIYKITQEADVIWLAY